MQKVFLRVIRKVQQMFEGSHIIVQIGRCNQIEERISVFIGYFQLTGWVTRYHFLIMEFVQWQFWQVENRSTHGGWFKPYHRRIFERHADHILFYNLERFERCSLSEGFGLLSIWHKLYFGSLPQIFHRCSKTSITHQLIKVFLKIVRSLLPHNSVFFNVDAQPIALLKFANTMQFFDYQPVFDIKLEIFILTHIILFIQKGFNQPESFVGFNARRLCKWWKPRGSYNSLLRSKWKSIVKVVEMLRIFEIYFDKIPYIRTFWNFQNLFDSYFWVPSVVSPRHHFLHCAGIERCYIINCAECCFLTWIECVEMGTVRRNSPTPLMPRSKNKSISTSSKSPNFTLVEMSIDSQLKFGAE